MVNKPDNVKKIFRLIVMISLMVPLMAHKMDVPHFVGPSRIYVDTDAAGSDDGTSWSDAYVYLQDALDQAYASGGIDMFEIWVAEGVYYPDEDSDGDHTDNDFYESFKFYYDNVKMYGGFAGGETSLDQRDWENNLTILSGDIDGNDTNTDGNYIAEYTSHHNGLNSHHVVRVDGYYHGSITSNTVLDGFTITAGSSNGGGENNYGGGIFCYAAGPMPSGVCNPSFRNLVIIGNYAYFGAGAFLYTNDNGVSNPTFTNVSFIQNHAADDGGGIYTFVGNHADGESLPVFVNTKFRGNYASSDGGGIYFYSNKGTGGGTLTNIEFYDNAALGTGGAMYIYGQNGNINIALNNISAADNEADYGGALYNKLDNSTSYTFSMEIHNSIFWDNIAHVSDPEILNVNTTPSFINCDIEGSFPAGLWDTSLGTDVEDNLDLNPLFEDVFSGDLSLQDSSPVIDAGNQALLPVDVTDLDLDGNSGETLPLDLAMARRVMNGNVDMGAYETKLDPTAIADFSGDGDTDFSFYRPSNGYWYYSDDGTPSWTWFGAEGTDIIVPGDYNGDGDTDFAYYRPSNGYWYVKDDGAPSYTWWGAAPTDILVPGDYNGDGDTDFAYYRPSTGFWYVKDDGVGSWTWWGAAPTDILVPGRLQRGWGHRLCLLPTLEWVLVCER